MDGDERVRLFVALELPEAVRSALVEWRPAPRGLRLVDAGALHVTLCFLGWRTEHEVEAILDACATVAAFPAASLTVGDALWLPPRRPRVLAVRLIDAGGRLAEAQAALSTGLSRGGWYTPEARPFLAHVTVARVARGARAPAGELPPPPELAFEAERVTLYRSRLSSGGARYEPLGTVVLGSGAPVEDPVSVVRRFHAEQARAYALGDLAGLPELLCDDVVWHVPGESAIAGEHRGRQAVLDYLARRRSMTDATFRVNVHGVAMIDRRVVQLAGGRAVRDGRELTWETVGVFSVRDGRISECWLVPFDQRAFDEIWA
jgi:2'-5' RNA ligase